MIAHLINSLFPPPLQRTLANLRLLPSPCLNVRPVTCNVSRAAQQIFIKFGILRLLQISVHTF